MAQEFSFDVVSDFDRQEMVNAVDQARREILGRYDFKNVVADISLDKDEITIVTAGEMHRGAIEDAIKGRAHRRGIDLKVFDPQKPEEAAKGNVRQVIKLRRGIADDVAKEISKRIKSGHPRVQVRIQGDQLRVSGKDKDALQAVIQDLKSAELDVPLQFTNYR